MEKQKFGVSQTQMIHKQDAKLRVHINNNGIHLNFSYPTQLNDNVHFFMDPMEFKNKVLWAYETFLKHTSCPEKLKNQD